MSGISMGNYVCIVRVGNAFFVFKDLIRMTDFGGVLELFKKVNTLYFSLH